MTIQQIQAAIDSKANDPRQLINMIADYIQQNPGGSGPSPSSSYLVATKVLNNSNIINLPVLAYELIPAPGTNKTILPFAFYFKMNCSAGVYGSTDADTVLPIGYGTGILSAGTFFDSMYYIKGGSVLTNSTPKFGIGNTYGDISTNTYNAVQASFSNITLTNKPLVITAYNQAGVFSGGNIANTLTIVICYTVIDI